MHACVRPLEHARIRGKAACASQTMPTTTTIMDQTHERASRSRERRLLILLAYCAQQLDYLEVYANDGKVKVDKGH